MGEGGAVLTQNDDLALIARSFRDWGRDCFCSGGENNSCGRRFSHNVDHSHLGMIISMFTATLAII